MFVPGSESSEICGMRSSRCWMLGGACGEKQRADEAKNENELIGNLVDIFMLVLVEVPHTRSIFCFVLNISPMFLPGAA